MAIDIKSMQQSDQIPITTAVVASAATDSSTLDRVRGLLDAGHVEKALHLAHKCETDRELKSAVGVCQMRLGHAHKAVAIYRSMTLAPGGVCLKADLPDKYRTNFATALLLTGNVSGCTSTLSQLRDANCPAAKRLRAAIDGWKKTLPFWQRVKLSLGLEPDCPVRLDFPPGDV